MFRLLVSSLSFVLITASSVLAADEGPAPGLTTPAIVIAAANLAEAQQSAILYNSNLNVTPALKPVSAPKRPLVLPALYGTSVALQAFDVYSTMSALKAGAVEQNPLMKGVVRNPAAFVAVKASVTVASVAAAEKLWRGNHRVGAIGLMIASNAMMGFVAAHNASVLSSLR
jgi:hypothetical protein